MLMQRATIQLWLFVAVLVLMLSGASRAQQAPQRTTAAYGDWLVRCDVQPGNPPQKSCDVAVVLPGQGQNASPLGQVLISRPNKKEPMRLVVQLVANVLIPPGVRLIYDDKQPVLAVPFSRCFPAACFASAPLADDAAKKLHARADPGRLEYKDGTQKDVAIAVSFNGFSAAFDAWQKE
jgi:invasion protein IalB